MTFVSNVLTFNDQSAQNATTTAGLRVGQATPHTRCFNWAGTVQLQDHTGGAQVLRGTVLNLCPRSHRQHFFTWAKPSVPEQFLKPVDERDQGGVVPS
jgi:hypothetical protein